MAVLSDTNQSKTRFHLGYTSATPAGDRARLEAGMNEIQDSWTLTRIEALIVRCESAFTDSEMVAGSVIENQRIEITGDAVRTTKDKDRDSFNKRQRAYLLETNNLANALGVRNYRDPSQASTGYLREGGTYINSIPGIQGDKGDKGDKRDKGDKGDTGEAGSGTNVFEGNVFFPVALLFSLGIGNDGFLGNSRPFIIVGECGAVYVVNPVTGTEYNSPTSWG